MFTSTSKRLTIGFLSSWHVFEGASAEPYSHALMRGIRAAAEDHACRLLLACGVGPLAYDQTGAPAWPDVENENTCFVPVGPWNTDGLIVLSTEMTPPQRAYIQSLRQRGFPIVFAGPGEEGPAVYCGNSMGVCQAVRHLYEHGHRQMAFIAGLRRVSGDSNQRQQGFIQAMQELGLPAHPALMAYGFHSFTGGQRAMREILAAGRPFTALVASNDRSAMGAIQVLRESGRRVPEDVAVIGFDDILEARAHSPGLTTLRNDSFILGYKAAARLLAEIQGTGAQPAVTEIPVPLIIRQSCGCPPFSGRGAAAPGGEEAQVAATDAAVAATDAAVAATDAAVAATDAAVAAMDAPAAAMDAPAAEMATPADAEAAASAAPPAETPSPAMLANHLAAAMSAALTLEMQCSARAVIASRCRTLAAAFLESAACAAPEPFRHALASLLAQTEAQGDDVLAWNAAITVLRDSLPAHADGPGRLLDEARQAISERARQVFARQESHKTELNNRLNMMTAQLLAALDFSQARSALDQHLEGIGVRRMLVALFHAGEGDPVARSEVVYSFGFAQDLSGEQFATRQFPPTGWFEPAGALNLGLLPLVIPGRERGFAIFQTDQYGSLAVVVRSLVSALRTSFLYADAVQGRQMAEEADKLKSRFLSMVSHELRTPLNVIAGLSEVLLQQKDQPPGPDLWQDLERIYANSQHLGRLIGDVLDLVSSGAGRLRLLREPLDLAEVLRPVITTGEQMARDKGLAWSVRMDEHGPYVLGDRTRLRQAALNLVSNAVKFTYHGAVSLTVESGPGEVTISVDDSGIGIPPEEQHKLFTDFGQSEASIRRGISGLGLGLAITRELIERQGGKIGAVSPGQSGCGSTFFFSLPTIAAPERNEPALEPPALPRVLALAQGQAACAALAGQLQQNGLTLETRSLEAQPDWYERLLEHPPAALILDETVAAAQGWEILAALKRHEATAHLPVMVCALDQETGRGAVINLDYQLKPLNAEQIARVLSSHGIRGPLSTLLLVDDNAAIRAYHARLINQHMLGCRILEAENGREALEIMSHQRPDLVLLDLIMPEADGFTVLEEMRKREATRDVPVIVLTAKMITDEDIARLNQGVAAVLSKGMFNGSEIINHVLNVLEKNASLGTAAQRIVRGAIAYIHSHYAESLTRDQIANHVSISPDHLSDCFHQEMGVTPIAYLNRYRIYQARRLLEEGGRSITQVALDVGFSDSAHFSHVFQREVGVSPRAYQKKVGA